jgi:hypothetical protein
MEQPEIAAVAAKRLCQNSVVRLIFSSPAVYGWVAVELQARFIGLPVTL